MDAAEHGSALQEQRRRLRRLCLFAAAEQHRDADTHQGHRPPGQQQLGQVQMRPAEIAGEHEQADQDQQDGGNKVESHRVGEGSGLGRIS